MTNTTSRAEGHADPERPLAADALAAFVELGQINLANVDMHQVLTRVAELARAVIPDVAAASVTLLVGAKAETAAFAGELAVRLDERQYAVGDGPCLEAARNRATYTVHDTAQDDRWPVVTALAVELGVRSWMSVGIPVQEVVAGGLNLYARETGVFDSAAETLAETFATYAAVAIANAYLYATTAALAGQMSAAMESRAVIEQAKGILMAQQHLDADQAFRLLSQASQSSNRKLRDIAAAVVAGVAGDGHRVRASGRLPVVTKDVDGG